MAANEAWGLDIGQCGVRLVKMHRHKGRVQITDFASVPLDSPPDDPQYDQKVVAVLTRLIQEKDVGHDPVYVGLSGFTTFYRDFTMPAMRSGKLGEIVAYEARQQIPYPLEEVLWGYHVHRSDPQAAEVDISLVCCRRDIVANLLLLLQTVGLNVQGVQSTAVALVNFLRYDQPPEEGVTLLLDSGARATDFILLDQGKFWLRSIAVAGADLSKALMGKFNLSYADAESLKRKMARSKQADRVFQVISPVLRTLTGEVQRSMGFYKSQHRGTRLEGLVCAGGTFLLAGVDKHIADALGVPPRRIQPAQNVDFASGVDAEAFNRQRQVMGAAAGLALQGVGAAPIEFNLLPPEIQRKQLLWRKYPYAVTAAVLLTILTVVSLVAALNRSGRWTTDIQRMQEWVGSGGKVSEQQQELDKARREAEQITQESRELAYIAEGRGLALQAMSATYARLREINDRRDQMVEEAGEFEALKEQIWAEMMASERMPPELYARLQNETEEDLEDKEYVRTKKFLRDQCEQRARRITDRRLNVFLEDMDVMVHRLKWSVERNEDGEVIGYYSPQEVQTRVAQLNREEPGKGQEWREKLETLEEGVEVAQVRGQGFVVVRPEEFRHVLSLRQEFGEVPGVHDLVVRRQRPETNPLPVAQIEFQRRVIRWADQRATAAAQEGVQYTTHDEPVYTFSISFVYCEASAQAQARRQAVEQAGEETAGAQGGSGTVEEEPEGEGEGAEGPSDDEGEEAETAASAEAPEAEATETAAGRQGEQE